MSASFTPGEILVSKWGYDQTNVTFYKVIRCTDKTVWVREIRSHERETGASTLRGQATPDTSQWAGEIMRRKNWGDRIYITPCTTARPWNGAPVAYTQYAYPPL